MSLYLSHNWLSYFIAGSLYYKSVNKKHAYS